jgi:hypothetical protein
MFERLKCPICNARGHGLPSRIAPFVVYFADLTKFETLSMYCSACDFVWFSDAYDEEELARLYSDYRGERYNATRLRIEPGYIRWIETVFDDLNSDYYSKRLRWNREFFRKCGVEPKRVLDFGGDGSIPARLFTQAQVDFHDLSHGSKLDGGFYDLVFAAHVMEHASKPSATTAEIRRFIKEAGFCYLEVPADYQGELKEAYFDQFHHGGALFEMHEHINHFSPTSLQKLLLANRLEPVYCEQNLDLSFLAVLCRSVNQVQMQQLTKVEKVDVPPPPSWAMRFRTALQEFQKYTKSKGLLRALYLAACSVLRKMDRWLS